MFVETSFVEAGRCIRSVSLWPSLCRNQKRQRAHRALVRYRWIPVRMRLQMARLQSPYCLALASRPTGNGNVVKTKKAPRSLSPIHWTGSGAGSGPTTQHDLARHPAASANDTPPCSRPATVRCSAERGIFNVGPRSFKDDSKARRPILDKRFRIGRRRRRYLGDCRADSGAQHQGQGHWRPGHRWQPQPAGEIAGQKKPPSGAVFSCCMLFTRAQEIRTR